MCRVENIEQTFEFMPAPPAAVTENEDQREQTEQLNGAVDQREREQIYKERQQYSGEIIRRGRKALRAERAEVKQTHAHGQSHARDAVIDIEWRKTAHPRRQRDRQHKRNRTESRLFAVFCKGAAL